MELYKRKMHLCLKLNYVLFGCSMPKVKKTKWLNIIY